MRDDSDGDDSDSESTTAKSVTVTAAPGRTASAASAGSGSGGVSRLQHKTTALLQASALALTSTNAVIGRSLSISGLNGCYHYYARPASAPELDEAKDFKFPAKPAREWKFRLDDFQRLAITCIDHSHNVLVAAHTSAGKTVVAEYAIAVALRDKQRVIYTAPIKVLSNQKYRELKEIFDDVGLMTGDVNVRAIHLPTSPLSLYSSLPHVLMLSRAVCGVANTSDQSIRVVSGYDDRNSA